MPQVKISPDFVEILLININNPLQWNGMAYNKRNVILSTFINKNIFGSLVIGTFFFFLNDQLKNTYPRILSY